MADHLRKQIRDAAVRALKGSDWRANVHASRRIPLQRAELPAFLVYTVSEDSEAMNTGSVRHLQRSVELVVEAVTQVADETETPLDDALDALATEIETLIGADPTFGGLAYDAILTRSVMALQDTKTADVPTGSIALTFRVPYRTRKDDPTLTN